MYRGLGVVIVSRVSLQQWCRSAKVDNELLIHEI